MSDELDKLAAELQNIKPSKTSRQGGLDAAMAAFDTEFARKIATTPEATEQTSDKKIPHIAQGSAAAPRPTGHTTHTSRVQTFGRNTMANMRKIFNFTPKTAMMGSSCMAAFIAGFVIFQGGLVDDQPLPSPDPAIVSIAEPLPETPVKTPTVEMPVVETPPKSVDIKPAPSPETAVIVPPVVKTPATPKTAEAADIKTDKPSNIVTIERRVLKTPARTIERAVPSVTKMMTRRVKNSDGTFKTVNETVVAQEASTELVTVPAEYETVSETIEIAADGSTRVLSSETVSSSKIVDVPSGISSVSDLLSITDSEIVVTGSHSKFASRSKDSLESYRADVADSGAYLSARGESGSFTRAAPIGSGAAAPVMETMAVSEVPTASRYVERAIPAVTKQVTRRVVKTPARTTERYVPAITKDVTVQVLTEDGTYKNVTKTFVIQEATTELVTVPPVYQTVKETIVTEPGRTEMVMVDADGNVVMPYIIKPPKPQPLPQSGRLTAGDYDDVLNPDLYKLYLDKTLQGPLKGKDLPYVDANKRINIRVIDRLGKAVPMADISLTSADGEGMFPLRTGADGMAYIYPNFDGLKPGVRLKVSTDGARSVKKTLSRTLIENGGDIVIDLNTNRKPIENLDLLLTIDATGSMSDEMHYLQSELKAILGRVEEANPGINIRTGLIVYRDVGDDYVVREIPFTGDIDSFRELLGAQSAGGGGDTPEAMHTAMRAGLEMGWREDALKVNLLVADAPPHDEYITDTWEAGLLSRTKGIHVVPLAASGVDKTAEFVMRSMAQVTGGRFLFLTDDSGIGNAHAEPTVDCYVVTRLDGLVTRVLSSLIKGERVEPDPVDVIRSVGNYRSGTCAIESNQANLLPVNTAAPDEQ